MIALMDRSTDWVDSQIRDPPRKFAYPGGVPCDIAVQHCRMALLSLMRGEREKAHQAIDRAFDTADERSEITITWQSHINEILAERAACILYDQCGIETVGELVKYTPQQLAAVPNLDWKTVGMIQDSLREHGFVLGVDE